MSFSRILIIRSGAIGDFILTLPAIRTLRETFPQSYIEIMGHPWIVELAAGRGYADAVSDVDQQFLSYFFVEDAQLPPNAVEYFSSFDLIVSIWRQDKHVFDNNLRRTGARRVVAVNAPTEAVTFANGAVQRKHASRQIIDALGIEGLKSVESAPRIFPAEDDRRAAEQFWQSHPMLSRSCGTVVSIHPGSGSTRKCWAPDRFAEVARYAAEKHDASILLTSGSADDIYVERFLGYAAGLKLVRVADQPLTLLAAILERSNAHVGNDSGVTHMAAAVRTATVAVFGPTDPQVWAPVGDHVAIVEAHSPCAPCSQEDRMSCSHRQCLQDVPVKDVVEKLELLLNVRGSRQ